MLKVKLQRATLQNILNRTKRATLMKTKAGQNASFQDIKFCLEDGWLVAISSNDVLGIRFPVLKASPDVSLEPIQIPAKKLSEAVEKIIAEDVLLSIDDEKLQITLQATKQKAQFKAIEGDSIIRLPECNKHVGRMNTDDFKTMVKSTQFAACDQIERGVMAGILFVFGNKPNGSGRVTSIATDGYQASVFEVDSPSMNETKILVPQEVARQSMYVLDGSEVEIYVDEKCENVIFEGSGMKISGRLMPASKYPDVMKVFPKEFSCSASLKKLPLENALALASVTASEMNQRVDIQFSQENKRVLVRTQDQGGNETMVGIDALGETDFEVCFNTTYLTEILKNTDGENIVISGNAPKPGLNIRPPYTIQGETDARISHITMLMPLSV